MYKIKLSPYAKIFYTEWLLNQNSNFYNLLIDQTLYGVLDVSRLRNALKRYISEHVLLNSHIQNINENLYWIENNNISELEYSDNAVNTSELFSYVSRSFDLHNEPLYRFKLLRINKDVHRLILIFHHIVVDGSASLDSGVFESISNYYNDKNYTTKYTIDDQVKLISNLENVLSANLERNKDKYKEFWCQQLSGIEPIDLSFLRIDKDLNKQNKAELYSSKGEINFNYNDSELFKLEQIKTKYGITPYVYGQCIFSMLLHRYTNQDRLTISYPITIKEGLDFIYGAQLNTNIIPYQFNQTTTIIDLFNQGKDFFKSTIRNDIKHGYYPITNIVQDGANKQLLNVFFVQTFFREHPFKFNGIVKVETFTELSVDGVGKNVLLVECDARNNKLNYRIRYYKNTISEELLNNFISSYKKLFIEVIDDFFYGNNKSVFSYNLLTSEQYQQILYSFNKTDKDYPSNKTIHQLFEEQVSRTPNSIAVVYEDTKLTYQELNNKANQLANHLLQNYDIKPDDLVALCLDRNEQMLIAILGVLKSGGAYVPLDPIYPDDRIKYILNDTKAKAILTNNIYANKIQQIIKQNAEKIDILTIDSKEMQIELSKQKNTNSITSTISNDLAYVIYTSGTTGNPKGVMVEHKSVINTILSLYDIYDFSKGNKSTEFTSYTFDVSVSEFFIALFRGAELHLLSEEIKKDALLLSDYIKNIGINYIYLPPVLLSVLPKIDYESLRGIVYAGEPCNKETGKYWSSKYALYNYYGPTEATIYATGKQIVDGDTHLIGSPISNTKCYILDKNLSPMPIGAIGELCIGGAGLARGYLNNPNLTTKKFISNPFQTSEEKLQNKNSRIYKTGDLVRWLRDGNIEYIGRNDFQVKIRGYRIELGEIENKLLNYPGIKQAVVLLKERTIDQISNKYLLAYYVSDKKLDEAKIQSYLTIQLPKYMLPQILMHINKLPLTISGKLDKKALPDLEFTNSYDYVAPKNQLQSQIIDLWSEILIISKELISITDSFFDLGGNSILAINLITKLSKINECKNLKVTDIFKYTTIEQLTKFIEQNNSDKNSIHTKSKGSIETEIAIIAISGAFSGCENINQYWDLIQKGAEGVKRYTREECIELGISEEVLANSNFVPTSGHVPNIDKFDAAFWGLSPNDAKSTDPQMRKFLEHCWYVLEESGYLHARDKISIGMFAGAGNSGYLLDKQQFSDKILFSSRDLDYLTTKDILATRISYLLNLAGVAINISTACSTSLITVVEACIHLASGYCEMAIAGGVSLLQPEEVGHIYQDGMIYSKDGYCRVFDNRSSGIVHGSGVGVVLLKRLSDAKKDNDNILAVIKGYSANNDGNRKMSYTSPSVTGQEECIINAQSAAKITSDLISYVECHGTGTRIGDPIEIMGLDEVFKYNTKQKKSKQKCVIGSVKANIGHADIAAGIASLIKVCKMLEHKIIPKQINYETVNTELHLDDTNFEIATETRNWDQKNNIPRIAGVSSFGIGGTNAHVVISEYIPDKDNQKKKAQNCKITKNQLHNYILPLSAKSSSSLEAYKKDFIDYLTNTTDDIKSIAYTLQLRREYFNCRLSVTCNSVFDAINKLQTENNINRINNQKQHSIVFMFPGQGNQYANMSLDLYKYDTDYKNLIDKCIRMINKYTNIQFEKILFPILFSGIENQSVTTADYDIDQAKWAQLAMFVIEYSLAKLLENLNINAVCYIGHSIGEYVAATLSGVFSLEDAIKLIIARGQLMQSMPKGAMLSVLASALEIEQVTKNNHCEIATINSPKNCVASGTHESINNLKTKLDKLKITTKLLKVSHAYHSRLMIEASKRFIAELEQIKLNKPQKKFISNVTGSFITDTDAVSPEYWANHMRNAVLFSNGIKTLFNNYNNLLFIEVGTGKSSISFVKQHDIGRPNIVQLLNSRKDNSGNVQDVRLKEDILNKLWVGGYNIDFNNYYNYKNHAKIARLPSYHFDSSSYWISRSRSIITSAPRADLSTSTSAMNIAGIKNKVIEQDQSDKRYEIAKVFLDALGVERISVHDNFFKLGGDSLLAVSVVAKLQQNYKISMDDFLKFPTIANVAEAALFVKNNLRQKLEQIKAMYLKKEKYLAHDVEDMSIKQAKYLHEAERINFKNQKKNMHSVLLTGATGHVGCNILYQILHETTYKIYLLIRASSIEEAVKKINHKFKHYFDVDLTNYTDRVTIIVADIEQSNLGLDKKQYQELINSIDSIIHSAALVKHYGDYDKLYKANVQATINLLELSKQTKGKDFHYISTVAVLLNGYVPNRSYYVFDENDDAGILLERNNIYAKTKYEGELAVARFREYGITSNIYRLGNVAMNSTTCRHQTNIEDNAFYVIAKTILNLGITTKEIDIAEISPVDNTALAIVRIFDQKYLSNGTYHVFNPNLYELSNLFAEIRNTPIKIHSINEFLDVILAKLDISADNGQIELFMLHQQWLQDTDLNNLTKVSMLNRKTEAILENLNFSWSKITKNMMIGMTGEITQSSEQ